MSNYYIGIDPGLSGAVGVLDGNGKYVDVFDIPIMANNKATGHVKNCINPKALYDLLVPFNRKQDEVNVWMEQVSSRPGDGASSAFSFGSTFGALKAVCACACLPINLVTPGPWKNYFKLTKTKDMSKSDHKELSRALAINLLPGSNEKLTLKKHHDRAEALLIARYGYEKNNKR